MFLCRILSIFFLLYTVTCGSLTAKNISQDNLELNQEKICRLSDVSKAGSELNDFFESSDNTLACSGEGFEEFNATFSDDSIFDDDRYGHVIEKFINEMEVFWQAVKSLIADDKSALAGNWWQGDTEHKYNQMKEQFYQDVNKELPQKVKDIINEYEKRYNDLMWSEIENMIINQGIEDNISEAIPTCPISTNINEKRSNENIEDPIDNKKCKRRSFEDVFQVKITRSSSFTAVKCDD